VNSDDHSGCTFAEFRSSAGLIVTVDYDAHGDVLYVFHKGAKAKYSDETPHDGYVIVSYDAADSIVGVTLLAASEMPIAFWPTHPDREMIPLDLRAEMDAWIRKNGKGGA